MKFTLTNNNGQRFKANTVLLTIETVRESAHQILEAAFEIENELQRQQTAELLNMLNPR